jgi:hypothetical protein
MPVVGDLSKTVIRAILTAIQEEDDENSFTFTQICNRENRLLGASGSKKRRLCQYRHRNFLKLAKNNPAAYLALLAEHNLPSRMPVKGGRNGKSHSDQNKNDIDYGEDEGKFVFVAHLVFSIISFDKFLTFFCFAEEDEEEDEVARTPPRTPPRNAKAAGRHSSAARKQPGSSSKKNPKRNADDDEEEEEEEQEIVTGKWFYYKNGEEGYADKIVPVCSKRGQGHLNDPVDYIAKLDQGVRMKHEGGTYKKNCFYLTTCTSSTLTHPFI